MQNYSERNHRLKMLKAINNDRNERLKRIRSREFTLVGFGFGGFITTFGGSFHAPAGLESWYDSTEGPAGGTLPKSVVDDGIGVVCPTKTKRIMK